MKGIKIDNRLLFRESMKTILRDKNQLTIDFNVNPIVGSTYSEETLSETKSLHYVISDKDNQPEWILLKDATNDEVISFVYGKCEEWKLVYLAEEPKEITRIVVEPAIDAVPATEIVVSDGFEPESVEYKAKKVLEEECRELLPLFELIEKYLFELIVI